MVPYPIYILTNIASFDFHQSFLVIDLMDTYGMGPLDGHLDLSDLVYIDTCTFNQHRPSQDPLFPLQIQEIYILIF